MNICIYNSQVIFRSYIHLYKYDDENECHLNSPYSYIHIPSHTSPLLNMENIHYSDILHHKTKLIHQLTYKYPPYNYTIPKYSSASLIAISLSSGHCVCFATSDLDLL